ncbi:MAG: helix-turn-helix transcriptional regulator [Chlorobi bacterium]|nr:helix-turn-helix transcriptional regulator [Chlorobiota bacterium]
MTHIDINVEKLELAANKLRAISHPMRIAIIELLAVDKKLSVTQIFKELEIEQATASHHLNILKNKGVLTSFREGKNIYYSLKNVTISDIIECINKCNET